MEDKQERLKSFFKEKGLTQEKVAELLGVSQAYVNSLFTGLFMVERPQPTANTPHGLILRPQAVPLSPPTIYRQ